MSERCLVLKIHQEKVSGDKVTVSVHAQTHRGVVFANKTINTQGVYSSGQGSAIRLRSDCWPEFRDRTLYVRGGFRDRDLDTVEVPEELLPELLKTVSMYNLTDGGREEVGVLFRDFEETIDDILRKIRRGPVYFESLDSYWVEGSRHFEIYPDRKIEGLREALREAEEEKAEMLKQKNIAITRDKDTDVKVNKIREQIWVLERAKEICSSGEDFHEGEG